jgi:glycosyltransferase involved in cell wall biosynthesis
VNILQVSATDGGGGAHKVALALYRGLRARGHRSAMAVGNRTSGEAGVYEIPSGVPRATRLAYRVAARGLRPLQRRVPGLREFRRALRMPSPVAYYRARTRGREYFGYPGSRNILRLPPFPPDVVHCHNLHSSYFDLRSLAKLSSTVPLALTLHDEWLYTGHCAYTMGIERWRSGCAHCPDLAIYPSIERDATHENWLAKRAIYRRSRLYVSAPSRWLLDRARDSILAEGAAAWRHIPNGVDHAVFRKASQQAARDMLGLPREHRILLFAANLLHKNPFKDYATIETAVATVANDLGDRRLLLIALGGEESTTNLGTAELRFLPYEQSPARVAAYYQAADIYLHAANADTFPTTILEALSVGRPVIATAVGGIEEQIRSLAGTPGGWSGPAVGPEEATGVLVAPHDAAGMAAATTALLADDDLRVRLGRNAATDAAERFDLERQLDATVAWYSEVLEDWHAWRRSAA